MHYPSSCSHTNLPLLLTLIKSLLKLSPMLGFAAFVCFKLTINWNCDETYFTISTADIFSLHLQFQPCSYYSLHYCSCQLTTVWLQTPLSLWEALWLLVCNVYQACWTADRHLKDVLTSEPPDGPAQTTPPSVGAEWSVSGCSQARWFSKGVGGGGGSAPLRCLLWLT